MDNDEVDAAALQHLRLLHQGYERWRGNEDQAPHIRIPRLPEILEETERFFYALLHNNHPRVLRENLRIHRDQYDALYDLCLPHIPETVQSTHEVLGVTLHWLATGASAREQETKFKLGFVTCHNYRHFGSAAIVKALRHTIQMPPSVSRAFALKFPYFDQALCAIDGVHIPVIVAKADADRFRSRKGTTSTNVLAASDWKMRVCYAYVGVEGSAHDSTVLAYSGFLNKIPDNYYAIADAGYALTPKTLTPYRGVRYHLSEWAPDRLGRPRTPRELFNLRHAKARNIVERLFGVIKRRFKLLRIPHECEMSMVKLSIFAAFCLHNFIRDFDDEDLAEDFADEVENEDDDAGNADEEEIPFDFSDATHHRDYMAQQMWEEYGRFRIDAIQNAANE